MMTREELYTELDVLRSDDSEEWCDTYKYASRAIKHHDEQMRDEIARLKSELATVTAGRDKLVEVQKMMKYSRRILRELVRDMGVWSKG